MHQSHQLNIAVAWIVLCVGVANLFIDGLAHAQVADASPAISQADKNWLTNELKPEEKHDALQPLNETTLQSFEDLLVKTLKIAWAETGNRNPEPLPENGQPHDQPPTVANLKTIVARWKERNWELESSPSKRLFVLRESTGHAHGRGIYVFRTGTDSRVVLQAPHRFNDLLTGAISIRLFTEQEISAIALNTIHRKVIDLSHTKLHYINAFTAAVLRANDSASILQVHGFTQEGKSGAAKASQIIVSDTTKFPGRIARQTAIEFKTTFGADHTRLFPIEVKELGGTTNRQSKVAQNLGSPNFLHLELSHSFRSELNDDASVREKFFASIVRGFVK